MKRFLSALTAFCMCASMTVGTIPVSAASIDDVVAGEYTWYVEDCVYNPGDGDEYAIINVRVAGDPGINAYGVEDLLINGKPLTESGFSTLIVEAGSVYTNTNSFVDDSLDGGHNGSGAVAATYDPQVGDQTAEDGAVVFTYYLTVPESAGAGDYTLTLSGVSAGNVDKVGFAPTVLDGILTIIRDGEEPTTAPSADPTEPTTDVPTPGPGVNVGDPNPGLSGLTDYTWGVENSYFNKDEDDYAVVEIKVYNDPGTNAYGVEDLLIDGKPLTEAGFACLIVEAGSVYTNTNSFVDDSLDGGHNGSGAVAATYDPQVGDQTAEDGAVVYTYYLTVPDSAQPGDTYKMSLSGVSSGNVDKVGFTPATVDGTLYILPLGDTPVTTDPIETDEPTEKPTAPDESTSDVKAAWDIGEVECEAGATVQVPVTVTGNEGFNSFIAKIKADAGPVASDATTGSFDVIQLASNPDTLAFGGTSFTNGSENVTGDGDVFYLNFTVPADAAPGTIYNLDFNSLDVYNADMVKLIPSEMTSGYIKIKDAPATEFVQETQNVDAEWVIGQIECEAGETVKLPVSVKGDTAGINSYKVKLTQDAGPVATAAEAGDAYAALAFEDNVAGLHFGGTYSTAPLENIVAPDGDVFYITFDVPADAAPGTLYNVKFADLELQNIDMVRLIPKQTDGWIKIKDEEPTTEPPEPDEAGKWIIGTAEVDPGAVVEIPVTVTGDKNGLNSYILKMGVDAGPTVTDAAKGNAFGDVIQFDFNADTHAFAGTNFTNPLENLIAAEEGVVFTVTFKVPDDAAPGTIYNLTFDKLDIFDINMSALTPDTQDGWIKIKEVETTEEPSTEEPSTEEPTTEEPTTEEPTTEEPTTEEPTTEEPTTEEPTTEEPTTEDPTYGQEATEPVYSVTWKIDEVTKTKSEAIADGIDLDIYVQGSGEGLNLNSFLFTLDAVDGSFTYSGFVKGAAYPVLTIDDNYPKFGSTDGSMTATNDTANSGDVILTIHFDVAEDVVAGVYDVKFLGDVEAVRYSGTALDVNEEDGSITIIDDDVTSEITGYEYQAEGVKFYFSHDPRPFDQSNLLTSLTRRPILTYSDGVVAPDTEADWEPVDPSTVTIAIKAGEYDNPKDYYDNAGKAYVSVPLTLTITDELGEYTAEDTDVLAYIGVKGDTNLNGECAADDAAQVLVYAAEAGAGNIIDICMEANPSDLMNDFVFFLSDIDGEFEGYSADKAENSKLLDASDAAYQLIYATVMGAEGQANWATDVLIPMGIDPLPTHSAAIYAWEQSH